MSKVDVTVTIGGWVSGLIILYIAVPGITKSLAGQPLLDYVLSALIIVLLLDVFWLLRREGVFIVHAEAVGMPVRKLSGTRSLFGARIVFALAASIVWIDGAKAHPTLTGWVLGSTLMFLAVLPWLLVTVKGLCEPR